MAGIASGSIVFNMETGETLMRNNLHQKLSLGEMIGQTYQAAENSIHNKLVELKEYVLDGLAWTMANVIIDQFGDAIVDWIRTGFDGSPMFLSDPEGFFKDTANQMSGAFLNYAKLEWLCNPLGKLNFDLDFFFPGTIRNEYKCTFDDVAEVFSSYADRTDIADWINFKVSVTEKNITNVFGDDFRNGGFLMWFLAIDERDNGIGNNDMGRALTLADDIFAAAKTNVETEKFGLSLNGGFFGVKKCVEYREAYDLEGSKTNGDCIKYENTTPGGLVQDQLKSVAGRDLSRLEVADEIDEIIGALATTMVGWLLTGGNEGGGVLGYDTTASYSASNRDHFKEWRKSQELTQKKMNISEQVLKIKNNEIPYAVSLESYGDALYGTKEKLEIILAKLKCIKATSTSDTSDNADCDGADENTKNVLLSAIGKTLDDITSDIGKTEIQIRDTDGAIFGFNQTYGENATSTSAHFLELFDEFKNKAMSTTSLEAVDIIVSEYCYSYDKINDKGGICGLFGEIHAKYETHGEKEYEALNKETIKIEIETENTKLKYSCILNDYTKAEGLSESECALE